MRKGKEKAATVATENVTPILAEEDTVLLQATEALRKEYENVTYTDGVLTVLVDTAEDVMSEGDNVKRILDKAGYNRSYGIRKKGS